MDLFYVIDDAIAIIRKPKGVYAQVKMYRRGSNVYIAYGAGFLRLGQKFGETWGTSHPDMKVIDYDIPGQKKTENPCFEQSKLRAVK